MSFLQISFSGAVVILTVLLIRAFFGKRTPKRIFLFFWWIVLFRLLIPFSVPSALSIYSLAGRYDASVIGNLSEMTDSSAAGSSVSQSSFDDTAAGNPVSQSSFDDTAAGNPVSQSSFDDTAAASDHITAVSGQEATVQETTPSAFDAVPLFFDNMRSVFDGMPPVLFRLLIWGTGAGLCAAFFIITWLRCRLEFRTSLPVDHPLIRRWITEHPLKRPLCVRQSDRINAPLTYGLFLPVILLPKKTDFTDTAQLQYILMHEYVHISRFDALLKFFAAAALCLHWFNPLVWMMYFFLNRDLELSCDESVIHRLGENFRSDYAQMLISMEAQKSRIAPLFSNLNKTAIEERIISIMKMKNNNKKAMILPCSVAIALFLIVTVVFSSTAAAETGAVTEETTTDSASDSSYKPEDYLPAAKADFGKEGTLLHNYEKFGISYDKNGKFYYKDQLVRYFWDGVEIKEDNEVIGWTVRYEYLNESGTVDVHTVRKTEYNKDNSMNLCGPVTGIQAYSQKEFDARDIKALTDPNRINVVETDAVAASQKTSASVGTPESYAVEADDSSAADGRTFAEIFAEYAPYGITYTETKEEKNINGKLFYNGQPVSIFSDTSGETAFSFSSGTNGIHVQAIRDKNGKLTGVKPVS